MKVHAFIRSLLIAIFAISISCNKASFSGRSKGKGEEPATTPVTQDVKKQIPDKGKDKTATTPVETPVNIVLEPEKPTETQTKIEIPPGSQTKVEPPETQVNIEIPKYVVKDPPKHGTIEIVDVNIVLYTPNKGYQGIDIITYVPATNLEAKPATITIIVTNTTQTVSTKVDTEVTITIDSGYQPQPVTPLPTVGETLIVKVPPLHGTIKQVDANVVVYMPNPGFRGVDIIAYVPENNPNATPFVIIIHVDGIIPNQTVSTKVDTSVTITINKAPDVTQPLVIKLPPKNGTVKTVEGNVIIYTPNPGFKGVEIISYVPKNAPNAVPYVIVIHVKPKEITVVTEINKPIEIILKCDCPDDQKNPPGELIVIVPPKNGTTKVTNQNIILYTPNPDFTGIDVIIYSPKGGGERYVIYIEVRKGNSYFKDCAKCPELDVIFKGIVEACKDTAKVKTVTQLIEFPELSVGCWGAAGTDRGQTADKFLGELMEERFRAYVKQSRKLNIPEGSKICDVKVAYNNAVGAVYSNSQTMYFDDEIYLNYNGYILAASSDKHLSSFPNTGGFLKWDWNALYDKEYKTQVAFGQYCAGGTGGSCTIPKTQTTGQIKLYFSADVIKAINAISTQEQSGDSKAPEFSMITTGDNNPEIDCKHRAFNLSVDVMYIPK